MTHGAYFEAAVVINKMCKALQSLESAAQLSDKNRRLAAYKEAGITPGEIEAYDDGAHYSATVWFRLFKEQDNAA